MSKESIPRIDFEIGEKSIAFKDTLSDGVDVIITGDIRTCEVLGTWAYEVKNIDDGDDAVPYNHPAKQLRKLNYESNEYQTNELSFDAFMNGIMATKSKDVEEAEQLKSDAFITVAEGDVLLACNRVDDFTSSERKFEKLVGMDMAFSIYKDGTTKGKRYRITHASLGRQGWIITYFNDYNNKAFITNVNTTSEEVYIITNQDVTEILENIHTRLEDTIENDSQIISQVAHEAEFRNMVKRVISGDFNPNNLYGKRIHFYSDSGLVDKGYQIINFRVYSENDWIIRYRYLDQSPMGKSWDDIHGKFYETRSIDFYIE